MICRRPQASAFNFPQFVDDDAATSRLVKPSPTKSARAHLFSLELLIQKDHQGVFGDELSLFVTHRSALTGNMLRAENLPLAGIIVQHTHANFEHLVTPSLTA
ncbi:hypothetical protein [Glutamicibacter ardleyensis]|uniref:hypothetical protein n=1 Tax=Glutamicibacter ardleyensis TaxID=225894 RepID=UPI003FD3AC20